MQTNSQTAVHHYAHAQQLQDQTSLYLAMFESLLTQNRLGLRAHTTGDSEAEYRAFTQFTKIAIGMRGLFTDGMRADEQTMYDFFNDTVQKAVLFASFEDRTAYYADLYGFVYERYQAWKKATGR